MDKESVMDKFDKFGGALNQERVQRIKGVKNTDMEVGMGNKPYKQGVDSVKADSKARRVAPKMAAPKEPVEEVSSDIANKLQDMKNQKAAEQWDKTHKAKGGCVKMAKGGTASSRADGCATKGKTKGRMV